MTDALPEMQSTPQVVIVGALGSSFDFVDQRTTGLIGSSDATGIASRNERFFDDN